MKGLWLFLSEIIANPSAIGAAWPSSKKLAQAMTHDIATEAPGFIIELGAGTGVITSALLASGISEQQLIVIEHSSKLAQHLRQRFAQLVIVEGDALQLSHLINDKKPIQAIISSLPLRSWSLERIQKIGEELDKILMPNMLFVQFTYGLFSKPLLLSSKLKLIRHQYILWNFPPARVDVFCHV